MAALVVINGLSKSGTYGCWGSGPHIAAAKIEFRRHGGGLMRAYQLAEFKDEAHFKGVDGFGAIHWVGEEPTITEVASRLPKRQTPHKP